MADPLGLSIGTRSIDLVQVGGGLRHPRLLRSAQVPLEGSLPADAHDGHALAQPLHSLLRQQGLTTCEAHLGIPSEQVIVRYFQMPKLPPADRPTAIRFEAKKYLPFKLEELISDFHVAIAASDPKVMRVMFYAVKKEYVQQLLGQLKETGVRVRSLDAGLGALSRALRRNRQLEPRKTMVLLALEHDVANIAIVRDRVVYLARNVTVPPQPGAPATLHEALHHETVVSIDYYRRRFAGEPPVSKVLVCGEPVSHDWLQHLATTLELPVEAAEIGRGVVDGQRLTGNAAAAFGLALRGFEPDRDAINLLPVAAKPPSARLLKLVGWETVAAAAMLGALYTTQQQPVRAVAAQLAALPPLPTTLLLPASDLTLDRLQQLEAERHQEFAFLRSVLSEKVPVATMLSELANVTPEEIWLRRLGYQESLTTPGGAPTIGAQRALRLLGSAYSPDPSKTLEAINRYITALNAGAVTNRLCGAFALGTVQRGMLRTVETTEFEVVSDTSRTPS